MKVQSVLLVALVAACALCAVHAAEPDAAQGPRWGFFRLQRLKGKLDEYSSDLTEAQKEEHRMHAWAKQFCGLTKDVYNKRVARAKASLTEWTDILNLRSKLVEYHKKRHIVYEDTHQYAKDGPASRRSFLQTCKAVDCPERWCKANPQECDRWTETRKHYFAANFQDHLARHGKVTLNAETRLKEAHVKARLAAQRVQDLRQSRTEAVQKCHDHVNKIKARFTARVTFLSTNVKSLNEAIVKLKAARAKREAAYRPFYMTKCHHLGGQHHAYNCVLDVHNRDRAHHRFSYCKPRGAQESSLHTLAFRCYK